LQEFIAKYEPQIAGILSGFDRLVFRGTLRKISHVFGLNQYLWANRVLFKDFGVHVQQVSQKIKAAALSCVLACGRPVQYLASGQADKEQIARAIADTHHIVAGPVCALTAVEPCQTFDIYRNRDTKQLDLVARWRKCLFVYQYWQHPILGWMNARIQTWFPFSIQICVNGREWLARQMDQNQLAYRRYDNCFPWVQDYAQAQRLLQAQLQTDWPQLLDSVAEQLNPVHQEIFHAFPVSYYWSTHQSEWATDVVFHHAEDLKRIYSRLLHHGITTFRSPDVLRFLGKRLTRNGEICANVTAEVVSDCKQRQEGVRLKHRYDDNSVKLYDKAYTPFGSVLRVETTLNRPEQFKVFRPCEGDAEGKQAWQRMRKGIADLHRRTEISQKTNARYLDALAQVDNSIALKELLGRVQHPLREHGRRVRALYPFHDQDRLLLQAVGGGEFTINGFRNKDLQQLLYATEASCPKESCRRSAAISRKLRLLRAHRLIRKIPHTYRYQITPLGRQLVAVVIAASNASVNTLIPKAA
jgi:hypothetical protein